MCFPFFLEKILWWYFSQYLHSVYIFPLCLRWKSATFNFLIIHVKSYHGLWVQVNAITLFEMICYCKMIKWIVKIYILVTNLIYIYFWKIIVTYIISIRSQKRQNIIPLFNFSAWPDVLQDTRHPKISIQCVIDNTLILSLLIRVWTHSLKFKNLHIMAFRQLYLSINLYNTKFSHF